MSQIIVVKVGGHATDQLTEEFFEQLRSWRQMGKQILIVHGGGPQISEWSAQLNLPVAKINGVRVTSSQTLKVTQAVLLGLVQPALCRQLSAHGLPVVGLNAGGQPVLVGDYLDQAVYGEVGEVTGINRDYIDHALADGIGVCAPLGVTKSGKNLNVNGDVAAAAVARLLGAEKLYLVTDVPGVMVNSHVIDQLSLQKANQLFEAEIIKSGMQPKIKAAFDALKHGVKEVKITNQLQHSGTSLSVKQLAI
ncbi:acetylglutamate kinase [Lentilactobacillus buchneri]|uniref:Acetylglutamate kinase n=1 Tax=Lentilactobacillus buchneri DSM 20057 TaxID=1423728 RepID=A0A4R5NSP9_LENBU|nr:acetylglutamate kinase [Lentilactobacillus buchneri]MCT3252391.1 acetylglutamate kinase [Lentilactobacillus buchneri]MCT3546980.1 acetylglutamate kinase [Lentilactobacillus buchneri]MCT4438375.1 acetylglutamate kinase [Lentilactobacillus buchneri]MQM71127.1 acetylglutamate kinase [Lentilactobacillus buchneri]QUX06126.1 acetylglutamate kinase [Lentilactobacillus buchneri]